MTHKVSADLSDLDSWVWDPIFPNGPAASNDHVFYLQARRIYSPDKRHLFAQLGHAIRTPEGLWLPDDEPALKGRHNAFDQAVWGAGILSLALNDHLLFYTGMHQTNHARQFTQSIGLARSNSATMKTWRRSHKPIITPAKPYALYESRGAGPIFRDPCPFIGPDGKIHLAFSARVAARLGPFNACIGHAVANDDSFTNWTLLPPLVDGSGMYGEMEVPQIVSHNGTWYVFFTVHSKYYDPAWKSVLGDSPNGLHCYTSDTLGGSVTPVNGTGSVTDETFIRGPRLIGTPKGTTFTAQGWCDGEGTPGGFVGGLSPQLTVTLQGNTVTLQPA